MATQSRHGHDTGAELDMTSERHTTTNHREKKHWTFLTSHGLVLVHVLQHPRDTVRRISDELGLSEKTISTILKELQTEEYLSVEKRGARNRYTVNLAGPLRHRTHARFTVRELLNYLLQEGERGSE